MLKPTKRSGREANRRKGNRSERTRERWKGKKKGRSVEQEIQDKKKIKDVGLENRKKKRL